MPLRERDNMLIDRAERLARFWHEDQTHSGGTYFDNHITEVVDLVILSDGSDAQVIAAYLHDIIEDTPCDYMTLAAAYFGEDVIELVKALTDGEGNRRTRMYARINRIQTNPDALLIKLADMLANVEACVRTGDRRLGMYRKEYPLWRKAMRQLVLDNKWIDALWSRLDGHLEEAG